jgi:hypothetical protein
MKKSIACTLLGLLSGVAALAANAVPVHISTGDYAGNWNLDGQGRVTGPADVDVAAGDHSILISRYGNVEFNVDASGNVTSLSPAAATGGANVLTFKTAPVLLNPQNYEGSYLFSYTFKNWMSGQQELSLVTGLDYHFKVGLYAIVAFHLNEDGTVTSLSPDSADASGSTVTLRNATINIDPADYPGKYSVWYVKHWLQAPSSLVVVPGLRYELGPASSGFRFDVDANGNISWIQYPAAATIDANTITFKTVPVNVDPVNFAGAYRFRTITDNLSGYQTVKLVPNILYRMDIGYGNNLLVWLDADGNAVNPNREDVMNVDGNTIRFSNIDIELTAEGADYGFHPDFAGTAAVADGETILVTLVPNLRHDVRVNAVNGTFSNIERLIEVQDPCAVVPGSHDFTNSKGSGTIYFSCPSLVLDSDNDSIPDESDNCPAAANTSQLDLDEDGQGDVCDADQDGDNVDNIADNCPAIANADQLDLDFDGLGDACDSDADGDAVQDVVDNCPLISNAGQGNSDGDSEGDACDADDDNDNVVDSVDNCPVSPNADQSDIDGDGEGDLCDGDRDGDGIANTEDQCRATPAGSLVNVSGCSGAQFIAMSCVADDFKNHGRYVSCVTKAAKEAVAEGLIDPQEKSTFVTEAAKSK